MTSIYKTASQGVDPLALVQLFDAGAESRDGKIWLLNPHRPDRNRTSFYVEVSSHRWRECTGHESPTLHHRPYGEDLTALYAYLADVSMTDAATALQNHREDLRTTATPVAPRKKNEVLVPAPDGTAIPTGAALVHRELGSPNHRYVYRNRRGQILGIRCRFEANGEKTLRPMACERLPNGSVRWAWRGFGEHIYGIERIHHTGQHILIVEGERKCDAAQRLLDSAAGISITATRPAHAFACVSVAPAGSAGSVDLSPLRGQTGPVYLWRDNDEPGQQWATTLAARLSELDVHVCTVRIPDGVPAAWDIADAIESGWDADRIHRAIENNDSSSMTELSLDEVVVPPPSRPLPRAKHRYSRADRNQIAKPLPLTGSPIITDWPITRAKGQHSYPMAVRENFEHMLYRHGISVQHNLMTRQDEIILPESAEIHVPEHLRFTRNISELDNLMVKHGIGKNASPHVVSIAAERSYCPFVEHVSECYYAPGADSPAALIALAATVTTECEPELWLRILTRFLISMVAVTFDERLAHDGSRAIAQFVPILCSTQEGLGKSTWLARLVPPNMFRGGARIDAGSKDSIDAATKTVLTELGEIESSFETRFGLAVLMSFVTRSDDVYRKAYARDNVEYPRRTVFAGTTNRPHLLPPSHDHRRFPLIEVSSIDARHSVDMRAVWGWVLRLYREGTAWWFSQDEQQQIAVLNAGHRIESPTRLRLLEMFNLNAENPADFSWHSLTHIYRQLGLELTDSHQTLDAVAHSLTRILSDIRSGVLPASEPVRSCTRAQIDRKAGVRKYHLPLLPAFRG